MGFESILTYIDGPQESEGMAGCAARLAREAGAKMTLIEVVKPLPIYLREPVYGYPALSDTLRREASERLEQIAAPIRQSGLPVETVVETGKPHEEIVRRVVDHGHDLVVTPSPPKGSSNRGASTAVRLCRISPAPVWAVSSDQVEPIRRILATVDPLSEDKEGDELNQRVIEAALEAARLEGGRVSVLYVWGEDLPPGSLEDHGDSIRALAEAALNDLLEPYGEEIAAEDVMLEFGEPAPTICRVAQEREMDLVVLGTIARTGVQALWIGNTAEKALGELDISVLAVKPPGFLSPLERSS